MTFEGIPITGDVASFNAKLKQKGLKFTKEGEYVNYHGFKVSITPCSNEDGESISLKEQIYGIRIQFPDELDKPFDWEGFERFQYFVTNDVLNQYTSHSNYTYSVRNVQSSIFGSKKYDIYTIYDKNNKKDILGQIFAEDFYFEFCNYKRQKEITGSSYPLDNRNLDWYDFSHYLKNSTCAIATSDDHVYLYNTIRDNNITKEFCLILRGSDKKTFLFLLNNGNINVKKGLLDFCVNNMGKNKVEGCVESFNMQYITLPNGALKTNYDLSLAEGDFNYYLNDFVEEQKKKEEQRQIASRKKLTSSQFLKIMCPKLFSDYELQLMDRFLPADFLKRAIDASASNSQSDFMKNATYATNKELNIH